MMTEKQLIKNLQALKQIKPNQDWAFSLKRQIIGEQSKITVFDVLSRVFSQRKLAYAVTTTFLIIVSMFGLSLIPISNNSQLGEATLLAAANESRHSLEAVNQKLEILAETAKDEKVSEATIQDIDQSIAEASKTITEKIVGNPKALKEIVGVVKKLDQNRKSLQTLGVVIDSDYQLNNILQPLVKQQIEEFEGMSLNEEQQAELKEIKGLYDEGQYSDALEGILLIANSK